MSQLSIFEKVVIWIIVFIVAALIVHATLTILSTPINTSFKQVYVYKDTNGVEYLVNVNGGIVLRSSTSAEMKP